MSKVLLGNINKSGNFIPNYGYMPLINKYVTCIGCKNYTKWILDVNRITCSKCYTFRNVVVPVEYIEDDKKYLFLTVSQQCAKCKEFNAIGTIRGDRLFCIDCDTSISSIRACNKCHFEKNMIIYLNDAPICPVCYQV